MRSIGLDVHRDFCEVAIFEEGRVTRHPRVPARRGALVAFASSLRPTDQVGLEATGNALAIARLIEPHVARVVVANAAVTKGIGNARAKTDQLDARTLAQLLGTGFFPQVWLAEEPTRLARRRMSRRSQLVRERTGLKNQIHAVLHRNLVERPPASDLFGVKGLRWLDTVELPRDERETVSSCLRQLQFLGDELDRLDQVIAQDALEQESIRSAHRAGCEFRPPRQRSWPRWATSLDSRPRASWSATLASIRRSTSPGSPQPDTAASPSRGPPALAGRWSSPHGWWRRPQALCMPSPSGSGLGGEPTSPPSLSHESSWSSSGTCSRRTRSTPSVDHRSPRRKCAGSSSLPEPRASGASGTGDGSMHRPSSVNASSRSPSMPKRPIANSSLNAGIWRNPLDLHP